VRWQCADTDLSLASRLPPGVFPRWAGLPLDAGRLRRNGQRPLPARPTHR